jgi:peptidoglycan glycosyltransferase
MNSQIVRLFGLVVVLFALLIAFTSRWTVFEAQKLTNNPLNVRTLIDELKIKRGLILARDGTVLAKSVPGPDGTWKRTYPQGSLFAQVIGYTTAAEGDAAGLELADGSDLRGLQTGVSAIFGQLGGTEQIGDDVYTSLDPKAQQVAKEGLAGRAGSVVALDPRTGSILAMYSNPTFNDNRPHAVGRAVSTFNRATQAGYPPGSTFKVVTATAAIDSGKFTSSSIVNGDSPKIISGVPLSNDGNVSWGDIDLTTALQYSVNTVWAQVAEQVGRATMTKYMQRFGFYSKPPLDYPPAELNPSRPWTFTRPSLPYPPGSLNEDIGRIGIGQGGLEVTPLQMAMVAAAVANDGRLMVPHFTQRVVNQTGQTLLTVKPTLYHQVMSATSAAEITQMMRKVVEEGTGQTAQLGNIGVAGKTGTASIGTTGSGLTEPWFIGFAPIGHPTVAVAVTVDRTLGGYGATVAAPIAREVMQTLLSEGL